MADGQRSEDAVVIERTLDAPVELIWQMWSDPEHFAGVGIGWRHSNEHQNDGGSQIRVQQVDQWCDVLREYRE